VPLCRRRAAPAAQLSGRDVGRTRSERHSNCFVHATNTLRHARDPRVLVLAWRDDGRAPAVAFRNALRQQSTCISRYFGTSTRLCSHSPRVVEPSSAAYVTLVVRAGALAASERRGLCLPSNLLELRFQRGVLPRACRRDRSCRRMARLVGSSATSLVRTARALARRSATSYAPDANYA
jgi:hypothetical protein